MLKQTNHSGIILLQIQHGKVNALDTDLAVELERTVREFDKQDIKALVLTGHRESFCAGANLKKMLQGRAYIEQFMPQLTQMLQTLFDFRRPMVAAINGHAIAAGYFIASTCDHRLMAKGQGKVGLPEKRAGLTFPAIMQELTKFTLPEKHQYDIVESGDLYDVDGALERGFVDELVSSEALQSRAMEVAKQLAVLPPSEFIAAKAKLRRGVHQQLQAYPDDYEQKVIEQICSAEAQTKMRAHLDKQTKNHR